MRFNLVHSDRAYIIHKLQAIALRNVDYFVSSECTKLKCIMPYFNVLN